MADEKVPAHDELRPNSNVEAGAIQHIHTGDVDAALQWLEQARTHTSVMSDADEKKLLRKIDWVIVLLMYVLGLAEEGAAGREA
jgi:hypothetical protein